MPVIHTLSQYLRNKYGCRVEKICVDAGFTCPTRDGSLGTQGCLFCDSHASASKAIPAHRDINVQIETQMVHLRTKRKTPLKFIVYFQPFSNTYAPVHVLRQLYEKAFAYSDVVGISVGTRPDTLSQECIALLQTMKAKGQVTVEIGVQSLQQPSLDFLQRGHTASDSLQAIRACREVGLDVVAHLIVGIPGETLEDMKASVQGVVAAGITGIKIHMLHVLKGTGLEALYRQGTIDLPTRDEYVQIVVELLALLPPHVVVHRLTGEAPAERLCAPEWVLNKTDVINRIRKAYSV